jgi:hypothetical protein
MCLPLVKDYVYSCFTTAFDTKEGGKICVSFVIVNFFFFFFKKK